MVLIVGDKFAQKLATVKFVEFNLHYQKCSHLVIHCAKY